jgi:citrate synthase
MCFAVPAEPYKVNADPRQSHGPHLYPARGPRTKRIDLHGASGGLIASQPVRLYRRRYRLPLGPCHGGANQEVLEMLAEIGSADRIPEYHRESQGQERSVPSHGLRSPRLQKHGSRAPRYHARELLRSARRIWACATNRCSNSPWNWRKSALQRSIFRRNANCSRMWTSIRASSSKPWASRPRMFTVLFAVARTVGWISQWKEMIEEPDLRIGRPRQLYTGPAHARPFVSDIEETRLGLPKANYSQVFSKKTGAGRFLIGVFLAENPRRFLANSQDETPRLCRTASCR